MADELEVLARYDIDIEEASGCAYHPGQNALYVVSDKKGRALRVDLDDFSSQRFDLEGASKRDCEGISVSPDQQELWVAAEGKRRVLRFTLDGQALGQVKLDLSGRKNSGIEGISADPVSERVYVVNEKKPRLLVTYDRDFEELARKPIHDVDDLSGVAVDGAFLWIVSDASQALLRLTQAGDDWRTDGRWQLDGTKAEGVAVAGDIIYVVYDERLASGHNMVAYKRPE